MVASFRCVPVMYESFMWKTSPGLNASQPNISAASFTQISRLPRKSGSPSDWPSTSPFSSRMATEQSLPS